MWHVDLGVFLSATALDQDIWSRCYGKDANCLDDGRGGTMCIEVAVARRLQERGWEAGWWNNYTSSPVGGPPGWQDAEFNKSDLRAFAEREIPRLRSLLDPSPGIADVIAYRRAARGVEVIAVECKGLSGGGDPVKDSQVSWALAFTRKFGLGAYALAEWRRTTSAA
jgi:hypothetical protein